jgi:hypothetical protein
MKMTKAEKKENSLAKPYEAPNYPYGLRLRLESDQLEKLGLESLPKVGAKMVIEATGVVTSVSQNESKDYNSRCVEIQIESLAVEDEETSDDLSNIVKRKTKRA